MAKTQTELLAEANDNVQRLIEIIKEKDAVIDAKVNAKIAELESWRNANDVEKIDKFVIDLSDFDANTMYPVYFRFGNGAADQNPIGEVNIGRRHFWNSRSPSPFSDNSSITYIAGLNFRIRGSDHPWGRDGFHGVHVEMYEISYMHTMQLFDSHLMRCYIQEKDSTVFSSDNSVKPTVGCPMYSGFYLRGGLLYKGFTKGMAIQPKLLTTATRIYNNKSFNRSEWLAPYPYDAENNTSEIKYGEGI